MESTYEWVRTIIQLCIQNLGIESHWIIILTHSTCQLVSLHHSIIIRFDIGEHINETTFVILFEMLLFDIFLMLFRVVV